MSERAYTIEGQLVKISKRLRILSSSAEIKGLSDDRLLSAMQVINQNHLELDKLVNKLVQENKS